MTRSDTRRPAPSRALATASWAVAIAVPGRRRNGVESPAGKVDAFRTLGAYLPVMNSSLCGNFSNSDAGLPKLVASTSGGLPATHSDRSMSS
jgi:hypothetical protein